MILFPYAKDIDYIENSNTLTMTLILFNEDHEANININFTCSDELSSIIKKSLKD